MLKTLQSHSYERSVGFSQLPTALRIHTLVQNSNHLRNPKLKTEPRINRTFPDHLYTTLFKRIFRNN